jgi:peptide/nickel transport system substrate-binding protein
MCVSRLQGPTALVLLLLLFFLLSGCERRTQNKGIYPAETHKAKHAPIEEKNSAISLLPTLKTLPESALGLQKGAQRGGNLRVHLESEPPHLNPLMNSLQNIQRVTSNLIYETLLECPNGDYQPGLAESWEISQDRMRIVFNLRQGIRFNDNRPFSSIDVQATLEYLQRSSRRWSPYHPLLSDVEAVDMVQDRQVRIRLFRPSDLTLRALCEIPIFPADPLRIGGAQLAQLSRNPVGTGPYRVASWERGKRIRLVRARPTPPSQPPFLDEIVFDIDTDLSRALLRVRRGEIDVLPRLLDIHFPEQISPAALRGTIEVYRLAPERYSYIVLNNRRGALSDARFREALSLLWDRSRFASEIHHGLAEPIGAPTFGFASPDPFNPAKAARLFEESGFRDTDSDGVREVGGEAIRLTFLVPSASRILAREAKAYALELRRIGILLDLVYLDSAALIARVEEGEFDMAPFLWEGQRDEDPRLLTGLKGDYQFTGYRSEGFSNLLELARTAESPRERQITLQKLGALLAADRPVLYLYRHSSVLLVNSKVHGLAAVGDRLDFRSVWMSL